MDESKQEIRQNLEAQGLEEMGTEDIPAAVIGQWDIYLNPDLLDHYAECACWFCMYVEDGALTVTFW